MALFIWNVALVLSVSLVFCSSRRCATVWLQVKLAAISVLFNISDIIQSFDHDKLSSISQLIKESSKINQIILMEQQLLCFCVKCIIISWCSPYYFWIMFKIFTFCYLVVVQSTISNNFISSIIRFISTIIPKTSWCHRIIVTIF